MEYTDLALAHWPFLMAAAAFHVLGVVLKNGPLSRKRADEVRWVRKLRRWFPLPAIIMLLGILVGTFAPVPVPDGVEPEFAWLYYLGASVAPIVWHTVHREFKKYRGEAVPEKDEDDLLSDSQSVPPN